MPTLSNPLPALPVAAPVVGGNIAPPLQATTTPAMPGWGWTGSTNPVPFQGRDYNSLVQQSLESFMNPNSDYIQNARQRGMEVANQRGGINSSIAAGASERAAIEAAAPLAQSAVAAQLGQEQVQLQDWLDTQGFNRELSAMPYQSSLNMLQRVSEYALQDPQLYTPSVMSGFQNVFNLNMRDMLSSYFND